MSTQTILKEARTVRSRLETVDDAITAEMERWGVPILRVAIAVIFIWFGALKIFGISPAGELVAATVYVSTPRCSSLSSASGRL
jgi:uncharacterized membrane protein YphA (DoxX/SURF4 family)